MCDKKHIHSTECGVSRRGLLTAVGGGLMGVAVPGVFPAVVTAQERPKPADLTPKDALDSRNIAVYAV